jgi:hypothetical protein
MQVIPLWILSYGMFRRVVQYNFTNFSEKGTTFNIQCPVFEVHSEEANSKKCYSAWSLITLITSA